MVVLPFVPLVLRIHQAVSISGFWLSVAKYQRTNVEWNCLLSLHDINDKTLSENRSD